MKRIFSVGYIAFWEILRDKTVPIIIGLDIFIMSLSFVFGPLSLGAGDRMILDLGLAVLNLTSLFVIILIGTRMVSLEMEERTVYIVLSKPISRFEFIIGKFMGMATVLGVIYIVVSLFYIIFVKIIVGSVSSLLFLSIFLSFVKTLFLLSIAIFFSTVATPVSSGIFSFFVYLIGTRITDILEMARMVKNPLLNSLLEIIYIVFPNLEIYNINPNLVYNIPVDRLIVITGISYGLLYIVFLLYVSSLIFGNKEIG